MYLSLIVTKHNTTEKGKKIENCILLGDVCFSYKNFTLRNINIRGKLILSLICYEVIK